MQDIGGLVDIVTHGQIAGKTMQTTPDAESASRASMPVPRPSKTDQKSYKLDQYWGGQAQSASNYVKELISLQVKQNLPSCPRAV
jgi:hypothetical protein